MTRESWEKPALQIPGEAASAPDSVAKTKLQEPFAKLPQRHVIIVPPLSAVRNARRVSVIEALGSHGERMEKNGAYAALIQTQELDHG